MEMNIVKVPNFPTYIGSPFIEIPLIEVPLYKQYLLLTIETPFWNNVEFVSFLS